MPRRMLKKYAHFTNHSFMLISIFGDICPTDDTRLQFEKGDPKAVFGDTYGAIEASDIVIGNLECAVSDKPNTVKKAGPSLWTSTNSIATLKEFDVLSMANNHIRDCGDDGVLSAIDTCKKLGIATLGAGKDVSAAREPVIITQNSIRIGIMAFAEREFNAATNCRCGANIFDVYDDFDRIRDFRKKVDYLIILYHGGIEYFPFASTELSRKCRKMADCGADLITCQHSHCIGTIDKYKHATIVYGQGNSIFGYRKDDSSWNRGLLIQITIENGCKSVHFRAITNTSSGIKWMNPTDSDALFAELDDRLSIQYNPELLDAKWREFCANLEKIHIPLLLGWPRLLVGINRRLNGFFANHLFGVHSRNITHNLIRCDAHREVIESILSNSDY